MSGVMPDVTGCHGNGAQHCCYLPGSGVPDPLGTDQSVCPFLEVDTVPGRKWVCGLRRVKGSWASVHSDPEYRKKVRSVFAPRGVAECGDWRVEGQCCFGPNNPPIHGQE